MADRRALRYEVALHWDVAGGRLRVASIEVRAVGDHEVDATAWRDIAPGGLMEKSRAKAVQMLGAALQRPELTRSGRARIERLQPAYEVERPKRPGPDGPSPSDLQLVADIYRQAVAAGSRSPSKTVAEEFTRRRRRIAHSTARKWVMKCREPEIGLLDPAPELRRSGEAPRTRRKP